MKVVIAGFPSYDLLDQVMEKLIEDSQFYLFYVVCGGTDSRTYSPGLSERWAREHGAPIQYIWAEEQNVLTERIVYTADYLVAFRDGSKFVRDLIMCFRAAGKHGTVI